MAEVPTQSNSHDAGAGDAIADLIQRRATLARRRAQLARDTAKWEMDVARLVSSEPEKSTWYAHPGPAPAEQVREALKMGELALHRLMERCRA
jgi:hypothetical protein